jgi:hypothetical protein
MSFWSRLLLIFSGPFLLGTLTVAVASIAKRLKKPGIKRNERDPDV